MARGILLAAILLLPALAFGATFEGERNVVISEEETASGNAYLGGTDVTVRAPLAADLFAAGGAINVLAPVSGDVTAAGGQIDIQQPVGGDVRAAGGRIIIENSVTGDAVLGGASVTVLGSTGEARIAGGTVRMTGGATGPVTVYGASVYLSGEFAGDVEVLASDRLTIGEGTVIHGALKYNAPQEAGIPAGTVVGGGVTYTGSSYLPTIEEAQTFAVAGAGVLFVVKVLAAVIVVGLVAGLFPLFSQLVADRVLSRSFDRFVLYALLGFGVLVATPVFILILVFSFVGIGLALLIGAVYLLLLLLAYVYACVLAGAALGRTLLKRSLVTWKIAVLGTLALQLAGVIPVLGSIVVFILLCAALGILIATSYRFAFRREPAEL